MDNFERRPTEYKVQPSFNLGRYGKYLALNCNDEFCIRLRNILNDCNTNSKLHTSLIDFFRELNYQMQEGVEPDESPEYMVEKYHHVFMMVMKLELAHKINQLIGEFLLYNRVSPAMVAFSKQLDGLLYHERVPAKERYADENY